MVDRVRPRFALGRVVATPAALEALQESGDDISAFLARHVSGDWGEICLEDKNLNDAAIHDGGRLLSAYDTANGTKLWIITEADRSATTILLPGEY